MRDLTQVELNNSYFEWLSDFVRDAPETESRSYDRLLNFLHDIDFEFKMGMDANRAEDGMDLRYRFGSEHDYISPMIAKYLDDRFCSIFEMMVALALRCEETIMSDADIGDRTGTWFWLMVNNLGLIEMSDDNFDKIYIRKQIHNFLERKYDFDGTGGLFVVKNTTKDLRKVEIWYQMCWYLTTIM